MAAMAVQAAAAHESEIRHLKRNGVAIRPFQQLDVSAPGELLRVTEGERYDVVLINDALMHMTKADVGTTLRSVNSLVAGTGAQYLVVNDHPYEPDGSNPNHDIKRGDWRPLLLTRPPYAFTPVASVRSDEKSGREAIATFQLPLPVRDGI